MAAYPPAGNHPESDDRQPRPFYTAPTRRLDQHPTGQLNRQWQQPYPGNYPQSYQPTASRKDSNTAMIIEILAGFFGFMGIGYLYAGYTLGGLLRLFGWFFCMFVAVFLMLVTLGIGLICIFPLMLIAPVISGLMLKQKLERDQAGIYFPGVYP